MHEVQAVTESSMRGHLLGLCNSMDACLLGLLDSKRRVAEGVHETRKVGKALRGGLALVGMPRATLGAVTAVGRMLAGQRDAVSRLKTWQRLGWEDAPQAEADTISAVTAMLEKLAHSAGRKPPQEAVAWAVAHIATVRAALVPRSEESLLEALPQGLRRLKRRLAKRLCKLGMRRSDEPAFHEARKGLKAWLGAQILLGQTANSDCLHLAELLGDENDLSALEAWLKARGFSKPMAPLMWRHLHERHHTVRIHCLAAKDAAKDGFGRSDLSPGSDH